MSRSETRADATPDFDRVADIYRWAEYALLGPLLARARAHFLPELAECRQALVLGDGDGRFLAQLLRRNTRIRATACDASRRMLQLLERRCHRASPTAAERLRVQQVAAEQIVVPAFTDLLVTHFFLDCFTDAQLRTLVPRLARGLAPGTLWLVSEFGIPGSRAGAALARLYVATLYAAFGLLTGLRTRQLPDIAAALRATGIERVARRAWLGGFVYTELWRVK